MSRPWVGHFARAGNASSKREAVSNAGPTVLETHAHWLPLLCERMLMRQDGISVTYMAFDLLSLDGPELAASAVL
jgi:hypothetical protein